MGAIACAVASEDIGMLKAMAKARFLTLLVHLSYLPILPH